MKVNTKVRYGLRAILQIAEGYGGDPVPISAIAESQEISGKYLEQVVGTLRKANLITSRKGVKGGYSLVEPPEKITLWQIISALDSHTTLVECVLDPELCDRSGDCLTRSIWTLLRRPHARILGQFHARGPCSRRCARTATCCCTTCPIRAPNGRRDPDRGARLRAEASPVAGPRSPIPAPPARWGFFCRFPASCQLTNREVESTFAGYDPRDRFRPKASPLMEFTKSLRIKAAALNRTIVLPEAHDPRMLAAAGQIRDEGFARILLLGDEGEGGRRPWPPPASTAAT